MRVMRLTFLLIIALFLAGPARAQQDLIRMFQQAQFEAKAQRFLDSTGLGADYLPMEVLPPRDEQLKTLWEKIYPKVEKPVEPPRPVFQVTHWKGIRRIERQRYNRTFDRVHWSYQGTLGFLSIDTSYTRTVRGRLEAHFGAPTLTLAEVNLQSIRRPSDYIQFEYWLVANDSIYVRVIDPRGPYDRGIVMATDQKYRHLLPDLRRALEEELKPVRRPSPYVDYYYDQEDRSWYRTGYDGRRYFTDRIPEPKLMLGRPRLDSSR